MTDQSDALSGSMPDPAGTPGLEPGGGVAPGDTPPAEGSMSGATSDRDRTVNQGPVSGNRTPMVITLTVLGIVVVAVLAVILARVVS